MNDEGSSVGRGLVVTAIALAVPALVLGMLGWAEQRAWAPVTRSGVRTTAEIVGVVRYTKAADRLHIAFDVPDGRLIESSVPVWDVDSFHSQSGVVVAYDPANPRRVRTVDDWQPPYTYPYLLAALFSLISAAVLWRAWRWPRRLARAAASGASRPMVFAALTIPTGRAEAHWGVLWPPGEGPPETPQYAFRLSEARNDDSVPSEVEVVGKVAKKGVAVVRTADANVIWPAGKLKPPPRAVAVAARLVPDAPLPAPAALAPSKLAALPELRGDLPPLPPEFFAKARKPRRSQVRTVVGLLAGAGVVVGSLAVPDVVEAHRQVCSKPPPSQAAAMAQGMGVDELAAALPAALPGYRPTSEGEKVLGSVSNPPTVVALMDAGFEYGFERQFAAAAGSTTAIVEVFQFSTTAGPGRYEAARLAQLCAFHHHRLKTPEGVSGTVTTESDAPPTHRMTFIRGSRDYIVNLDGDGVTGQLDVLRKVLATAA